MKAFLLAGGLGTRLGAVTARLPKCMVPIDGVPLLEIWLQLCERHGIRQVLLNVSRHPELVEDFLDHRRGTVDVTLVREGAPLGSAGTVLAQRAFVAGEDSFYVLYSDNLTAMDLSAMLAFHNAHTQPLTVGLFRTPAPRASGIVQVTDTGIITHFEEKPASPRGNLANAGIYIARRGLLDLMPDHQSLLDFGHDVLPRLVGRMGGYVIEESFTDIGTPEGLARARAEWPRVKSYGHAKVQ